MKEQEMQQQQRRAVGESQAMEIIACIQLFLQL
jgi:hypothetical protein